MLQNKFFSIPLLVIGFGLMLFPIGALLLACLPVVTQAAEVDTSGVVVREVYRYLMGNPFFKPIVGLLMSALVALIYQALEQLLKFMTITYRWTDNGLVKSLFWNIAGKLFGRSPQFYNVRILAAPEDRWKAEEELKRLAREHLEKHGGEMLKAFRGAVNS